jgi:hypothetical protein
MRSGGERSTSIAQTTKRSTILSLIALWNSRKGYVEGLVWVVSVLDVLLGIIVFDWDLCCSNTHYQATVKVSRLLTISYFTLYSTPLIETSCLILKADNTYNIFHQFWSSINLGIPETTIHYERMTSKDGVTAAIESIIYFMNQNDVGYNATTLLSLLKQKVDQVKSMVKEPDYKQGTLVAQVCGIEVATKVHKKTRAYSEALGYVFDKKSGHWSLQE